MGLEGVTRFRRSEWVQKEEKGLEGGRVKKE